jgi:hypothetical protein
MVACERVIPLGHLWLDKVRPLHLGGWRFLTSLAIRKVGFQPVPPSPRSMLRCSVAVSLAAAQQKRSSEDQQRRSGAQHAGSIIIAAVKSCASGVCCSTLH